MIASTRRAAALPLANQAEFEDTDQELVQLLIPENQVSDDIVESIIQELSDTFEGHFAFSTECSWLDRQSRLQSEDALVVEVTIREPIPENQTE